MSSGALIKRLRINEYGAKKCPVQGIFFVRATYFFRPVQYSRAPTDCANAVCTAWGSCDKKSTLSVIANLFFDAGYKCRSAIFLCALRAHFFIGIGVCVQLLYRRS